MADEKVLARVHDKRQRTLKACLRSTRGPFEVCQAVAVGYVHGPAVQASCVYAYAPDGFRLFFVAVCSGNLGWQALKRLVE